GEAVERGGEFVSPGPGRRDPHVEATAAAGKPCGDVQEPVAELSGLGGGEVAVQQQELGPGEQVDRGQGQLQPGRVDLEVAGGEAAEAGVFPAADAVLDRGVATVADLQVLG